MHWRWKKFFSTEKFLQSSTLHSTNVVKISKEIKQKCIHLAQNCSNTVLKILPIFSNKFPNWCLSLMAVECKVESYTISTSTLHFLLRGTKLKEPQKLYCRHFGHPQSTLHSEIFPEKNEFSLFLQMPNIANVLWSAITVQWWKCGEYYRKYDFFISYLVCDLATQYVKYVWYLLGVMLPSRVYNRWRDSCNDFYFLTTQYMFK